MNYNVNDSNGASNKAELSKNCLVTHTRVELVTSKQNDHVLSLSIADYCTCFNEHIIIIIASEGHMYDQK